MDDVQSALQMLNLHTYTPAFEEAGYDWLPHLRKMTPEELRVVAQVVSMKPGHTSRFVDCFNVQSPAPSRPTPTDMPRLPLAAPTEETIPQRLRSSALATTPRPTPRHEETPCSTPRREETPCPTPCSTPRRRESITSKLAAIIPGRKTSPRAVTDEEALAEQQAAELERTQQAERFAAAQAERLAQLQEEGELKEALQRSQEAPAAAPPKQCVGMTVTLEKATAEQPLGICLADGDSRGDLTPHGQLDGPVKYLTLTTIVEGGLAAASGQLMLGDMIVAVNGQPVGSVAETVERLGACAAGAVSFELQRVQDDSALQAVVQAVSETAYADEQQRLERLGQREDSELEEAMAASRLNFEEQQELHDMHEIRDEAVLEATLEESINDVRRLANRADEWEAPPAAAEPKAEAPQPTALPPPPSAVGAAAPAMVGLGRPRVASLPPPQASPDSRVYDVQRFFLLEQEFGGDTDGDVSSRTNSAFM